MDLQVRYKHRTYNSTATASMAESGWYTQPQETHTEIQIYQTTAVVSNLDFEVKAANRLQPNACLSSLPSTCGCVRVCRVSQIVCIHYHSISKSRSTAYCCSVCFCETTVCVQNWDRECTCLSSGSENTSLNCRISLGPDQNILQQIVGSHRTVMSRACHGILHILSLSPTT